MYPALVEWLNHQGIIHQQAIFYNSDRSVLITNTLNNGESQLTHNGTLVANTTPYTGRSPNDKYIVDYPEQNDLWWGDVNQKMKLEHFINLQNRLTAYLSNRPLYIIDCFIGADPAYQLTVRIVTEFAWQALASQNLFIYDGTKHITQPDMMILAAPGFYTSPDLDFVNSKAAIAIDLREKKVLIAASKYVGEIKKSAFTVMNALLPARDVLPMHCSANVGRSGDVALYFGLSGTGKTTLSSTPDRRLIGDDEHGWGENGIFNFEGGCYAKTIRLNAQHEPVIWKAANQYGTVLENVIVSPQSRRPDFDDASLTENTRAAYPLTMVDNIIPEGMGSHPKNIFFLTADAFGVMPPIAKLSSEEAIYYFLSGYTSKVAGTERGLSQMPSATFSTCFGEPFLPLTPDIYASLLKEKVAKHNCNIWLVNTGWTAGDFHSGHRMPLPYTRRMINWILENKCQSAEFHPDSIFGLAVPDKIQGIPQEILFPEKTWQNVGKFRQTAEKLKNDFETNFSKFKKFL